MLQTIKTILTQVRLQKPLVLNLTNYVTMDFMANTLLALGAAPIMTVCDEELEEFVQISNAVNLNIGTLDKNSIKRCHEATHFALKYHKPIIFDPVGSGASQIRTQVSRELAAKSTVIRGNASEIISLWTEDLQTKGVETSHSTDSAKDAARYLSKKHDCIVVVSGPIDFITDGQKEIEIPFGSPLMPFVTGMGCTLSSVIAAFFSVSGHVFEKTSAAVGYFGLCGSLTHSKTQSPGHFRSTFIDTIYEADFDKMADISKKKST